MIKLGKMAHNSFNSNTAFMGAASQEEVLDSQEVGLDSLVEDLAFQEEALVVSEEALEEMDSEEMALEVDLLKAMAILDIVSQGKGEQRLRTVKERAINLVLEVNKEVVLILIFEKNDLIKILTNHFNICIHLS